MIIERSTKSRSCRPMFGERDRCNNDSPMRNRLSSAGDIYLLRRTSKPLLVPLNGSIQKDSGEKIYFPITMTTSFAGFKTPPSLLECPDCPTLGGLKATKAYLKKQNPKTFYRISVRSLLQMIWRYREDAH